MIFLTIAVSLLATHLTHYFAQKENFGSVKASSLMSLIFYGATFKISHPIVPILQAVFFGASFIGMSDPKRMKFAQLFFASIVFAFVFHLLLGHLKGIGGALGFSAFVSCLVTYVMWKFKIYHITRACLRS